MVSMNLKTIRSIRDRFLYGISIRQLERGSGASSEIQRSAVILGHMNRRYAAASHYQWVMEHFEEVEEEGIKWPRFVVLPSTVMDSQRPSACGMFGVADEFWK